LRFKRQSHQGELDGLSGASALDRCDIKGRTRQAIIFDYCKQCHICPRGHTSPSVVVVYLVNLFSKQRAIFWGCIGLSL